MASDTLVVEGTGSDVDDAWTAARRSLAGLPGGGLNIAHEAVDRHAADPGVRGRTALRVLDRDGDAHELTYGELARRSSRFASVLDRLGVWPGDRVATLLGPDADLYVAALGILKAGAVLAPLFSAFGREPVRTRLELGGVSVLVTTPELYRRTVQPIRDDLPGLRHVLLTGPMLDGLLDAADPDRPITPTAPGDAALLHFTSGTTGAPKAALHVHEAVVAHLATARSVLGLRTDDVYWCTADPGWVTGVSYGIVAPLVVGATAVADTRPFDVRRWYRVLAEQRVTVWYTAPTALRMFMARGGQEARRYDLSALRTIASVGEPLNGAVVEWALEVLGLQVHDTWWQTETGAIMLATPADEEVRPGAIGRPVPGIEAAVLAQGPDGRARIDDGHVTVVGGSAQGELALRPGWPSLFRGYFGDPDRTAACFADGWYLTGDVVRRDRDGWYRFVARADDVIKTAGHLVGPFEVESCLMRHPAVAEAGVIGVPDPAAGALVKAFVVLRAGIEPSRELRADLLGYGRRELGAVAPRSIALVPDLPHTRSGKVMRRLLRTRELGLPDGDLSTLENPS
ncbi:acetate--CoA ligase [Pseudonocardia sp. N23]|uniref:acetate--CoA ligase n=1 Tax=Pseudonocardia sp. N23 TaxID=1987376 RepID=UPI000BFD3CA9|nr:acetate--CoA ligase [Pseudonocardia sp. N23]GAY07359.1 acetyl-coenzyme A synthetase [Pseudonocardia sp. N23]